MTGFRFLISCFLALSLIAETSAQVIVPLAPVVGLPVIVPNGIDFLYNSRRLKVSGFFATGGSSSAILPISPYGPVPLFVGQPLYYYGYNPVFPPVIYGAVDTRYTLQINNPPGLVAQRSRSEPINQDITGIDLDTEPATRIWGQKPDKLKVAALKQEAVKKMEAARVVLDERKGDVRPIVAPLPIPPGGPTVQELMESGLTSFRKGDFGIAILRFRKLAEANPPLPRAIFLQSQAYLAVGKYKEAIPLLHQGLLLQPNWRQSDFRPRIELYGNDELLWHKHVARLEQVQRLQPQDADYLFLLGYMSWFGDERDAALDLFRQARVLALDTQWIDLFLQAAE